MRVSKSRSVIATIMTLTAIFCAAPAGAVPMTQGDSIVVTFPAPAGNANLAASATVTLTTLTSTTATIDVSISNNTLVAGDANARLTAFGFLFTPAPTANSSIALIDTGGGTDTDAFVKGKTPDNVPSLNVGNNDPENVCTWTGNNCSGAGSTGLLDGQTDKFQFGLAGTFGSSVDLSNFGIKWQGCTGCSFEILGIPDAPPRVPEPATLGLTGAGLLALFAMRKLRRLE
jgi:PEP-CTERM motif